MVRMSVIGCLCGLPSRKREKLQNLLNYTKKNGIQYRSNEGIGELMALANQYLVMEKFMKYVITIERVEGEINLARETKSEKH